MVFFIVSCISLVLLYKSLPLKPLPSWANDMTLLSPWFWKDLSFFFVTKSVNISLMNSFSNPFSLKMSSKNTSSSEVATEMKMSILDLPELVLECILERLPPDGLCNMAGVCSSLRDRCMSDHFWERHLKQKWGRIIGPAAYREWQWHIVSRNNIDSLEGGKGRGYLDSLFRLWPFSLVRSTSINDSKRKSPLPVDSIISWYLALESGEFSFPAQVYNRENGHVGFLLSCYDAELCYDSCTDTFEARYQPHGRRAVVVEKGVTWDRIRAPHIDTSPRDLYMSDCLSDLRPGDHFEIQWRRNKEFPYGWWYGVVGHLESCDGNRDYCTCHHSDTVVLEFNQYALGSRWRSTTVDRKDHREEGNEGDGFYGGIRKLHSNEEISIWRKLWPAEVLE